MNLPRSERLIVHLDMNSFFATVEQQANRSLRGKPLGVCAYLGKHGCIIAPSREAKRLGVKVGMSVAEAKQRIPSMLFVQADPPKYRSVIGRVFSLLHELTDAVEHYSIDEAFMDCTGWYPNDLALVTPLLRVKERIRTEIGSELSCSIGVAPTRILAKLASDYHKPDGFTMVSHASLRSFLAEHDLTDISGIAERNRRKLARLGIFTIPDLLDHPPEQLLRLYGKPFFLLQAGLLGLACDSITQFRNTVPKSVGHSYCVPKRVSEAGQLLAVFMKLVEKAGRRLRALQRHAGAVVVTIGSASVAPPNGPFYTHRKDYRSAQHTFGEPVSDAFTLLSTSINALHTIWDGEEALSFLAITCIDLSPWTQQQRTAPLQTTNPSQDKRLRVSQALDQVHAKYGSEALVFGEVLKAADAAPDRIGFRKTEGIDIVIPDATSW